MQPRSIHQADYANIELLTDSKFPITTLSCPEISTLIILGASCSILDTPYDQSLAFPTSTLGFVRDRPDHRTILVPRSFGSLTTGPAERTGRSCQSSWPSSPNRKVVKELVDVGVTLASETKLHPHRGLDEKSRGYAHGISPNTEFSQKSLSDRCSV